MTESKRTTGVVSIAAVMAHASNIRKNLGDLRPLAASIRRHGVMVPIVVEKRGGMLRLRDGHRRLVAASMAGRTRIEAVIHDEALEENDWALQAVEINEHRRGMDADERRATIKRLKALGWALADIADAYGVTPKTIRGWAADPREPKTEAPPKLTRAVLAEFVEEWRAKEDVTVDEVLDTLEELVGPRRVVLLDQVVDLIDITPGSTFDSVSHRLNTNRDAIEKALTRANRCDLLERLQRNRHVEDFGGAA